jgi:hypothetical protein
MIDAEINAEIKAWQEQNHKNEQRIRETTLLQLWNDETADWERLHSSQMSEAEVVASSEFWLAAAQLYRDRAKQMRALYSEIWREYRRRQKQAKKQANVIEFPRRAE